MEIVREAAGLPVTGYRADRRLMEIDFGDFTWMTREEIAAHCAGCARVCDGRLRLCPAERRKLGRIFTPAPAALWKRLSRDAVIVTHFGPARG